MARPRKIGSSWKGKKYVHGPRRVDPKKCTKIRLGKPTKSGKRLVWCKKADGKWVIQSTLRPKASKKRGRK